MKSIVRVLIASIVIHLFTPAADATPDSLVAEGRVFLQNGDLANANARFNSALGLSANHFNANVFYAATRILILSTVPPTSTFLNRLGITGSSLDVYHWNGKLAEDIHGHPVIPSGVSAAEISIHLRTNLIPQIGAAITNLSKVTDTSFTLALTSSETSAGSVTLDYGDLLMLRAILHAMEYYLYTARSGNTDVPLTAIKQLADDGTLSAERLLSDFPNLFTFSTTADLTAARTAFQNFVDRYTEASNFIRNRVSQNDRLFMYDDEMAGHEQRFRSVLADLKTSLNGQVALASKPEVTVHAARHFQGTRSFRSFLPRIIGNGFALGTFPDITFDGLIGGVSAESIESTLGVPFQTVPRFLSIAGIDSDDFGSDGTFEIQLRSRGPMESTFTLQYSLELLDWYDFSPLFAGRTNGVDRLRVPGAPYLQGVYFRMANFYPYVTVSGTVFDLNQNPVPNARVETSLDDSYTMTDSLGRFFLMTSTPDRIPNIRYTITVSHSFITHTKTSIWGTHPSNIGFQLPFFVPGED